MKHEPTYTTSERVKKTYWGSSEIYRQTKVTCSCNYTYTQEVRWAGYQATRVVKRRFANHVTQQAQERRFRKPKRMELVGRTESGDEIWLGYLYGDLPPMRKRQWSSMHYLPTTDAQIESGKLWPWVVYKHTKRDWYRLGNHPTKEQAFLSARKHAGLPLTGRVQIQTVPQKRESFEVHLQEYLKELTTAANKSPAAKVRIIKKMKRVNATWELIEEAQQRLLGLDDF